ncbi:cytochrome P450 [Dactylosporangium sp. CA-092794]|uniref:cytochrome P450 n=1 Tax=Dactylosporangium sp. CA-092794 TaxID=3239929 RepID=UPI003D8F94F3
MTDADTPAAAQRPAYPMGREAGCPFAPPPEYRRLRDSEPISRVRLYDGREAWLFTRYEDIRAVLAHPSVSAETLDPRFPFLTPGDKVSKQAQSFQRWDDPRHATRRRMLMPNFTIKRIEAMRPRIRAMIDDIYDRMIALGPPLDLVEHLALALPSSVACDLLGVDYSSHEFFETRFAVRLDRRSSAEQVQRANAEVRAFVDDVVRSKYGANKPDLIGQFVTRHVETGEVAHEDAVTDAMLLLLAGHETTANMIALGTLALLDHPGQLDRVRADRGIVPNAVEELLRFLTISHSMGVRLAKEPFEISGQAIAAGDGLLVPVAAGNWDDSVFAHPERLDVTREARGHLTFGFGPHVCLGQPLARMELDEVFSTLFERFPGLRAERPAGEAAFKFDAVFYGLYDLPVTWDAEAAREVAAQHAPEVVA